MLKTGLFGGSFNPIHCGHIALAREIRRQCGLDEVWLMVSPQNPLKQQVALLADDERLQLARKALADEPFLVASDYEFHLPRPSYTWHTLQALRRDEPDRQFSLIIGGDNWEQFHLWFRAADILASYPVIVYPRHGASVSDSGLLEILSDRAPLSIRFVEAPLLPVSSTEVRDRVQRGESVDGLVPDSIVADVIKLYGHG